MTRRRPPHLVRHVHHRRDADAFQVGPDTFVTLAYWVRDEEGALVEGDAAEPISFVFGHGQLLPAVEQAAEGRFAGDRITVQLEPDAAYGEWESDRVIEVMRDEVPADAAPGDVFEAEHADGPVLLLKVLDLRDTTVLLDTNHPLAGQRVTIEIEVRGVRPATEAELDGAGAAARAESEPPPPFDVPLGRLRAKGV